MDFHSILKLNKFVKKIIWKSYIYQEWSFDLMFILLEIILVMAYNHGGNHKFVFRWYSKIGLNPIMQTHIKIVKAII
jgi:hypothetical protein